MESTETQPAQSIYELSRNHNRTTDRLARPSRNHPTTDRPARPSRRLARKVTPFE
jgi:hypothetical protein